MKLKTQLIITLSILILISVIIISAIIIANENLQNTNRNEKLIIDIESGYFELSHLESDYLINKGDREIEQWRSKYAIISDQIDELQLEDLDQKSLSANMKAGHVQLEPLFSDFISDRNPAGSTVSVSSRDERQAFRWSSLAMQTEKVTYDANELMRLLRADATATLEWFNVIILLSISMLLVSSVISYALITRSVIESLSRLRSGIEQVGSGELDARVDTGTDDELGDLALLFNEMADKLKMVMARKSELEKEVAERKRVEEQLKESETRYREFFTTSRDCVFISSPDGRMIDFNDATLEMFGYDNREEMSKVSIPSLYAHSEDRSVFLNLIERDGYVKEFPVQLKRRDGTVIDSLITAVPLRNPDGTIKALIGTARDITDRKRAEEEIQLLNATLEQRVRDRTQELEQATERIRASLDEKVILLREIHHRVKNNLQIIISLTNLQMRQIDDNQLKQVMVDTQNRVRAMSFVHEKLYQSEDLSHIELSEYTRYLATHLFSSYSFNSQQVLLNIDSKKIMLGINTAIPVGLIINELVSNSLKHAFPEGRKGEISIAIQREDHTLTIVYKDNGVGIPKDFDWRNTTSLGFQLVTLLVEQMDGTIELDLSSGTAFTIVVKEKE